MNGMNGADAKTGTKTTETGKAVRGETGLSPVEGLRGSWLVGAAGDRYLDFASGSLGGANDDGAEFSEETRFKGRVLRAAVEGALGRFGGGFAVRGEGLRLELDLGDAGLAWELSGACEERGVLVGVVGGAVRLAPSPSVTRAEIRHALDALRASLAGLHGRLADGAPNGADDEARFPVPASAVA